VKGQPSTTRRWRRSGRAARETPCTCLQPGRRQAAQDAPGARRSVGGREGPPSTPRTPRVAGRGAGAAEGGRRKQRRPSPQARPSARRALSRMFTSGTPPAQPQPARRSGPLGEREDFGTARAPPSSAAPSPPQRWRAPSHPVGRQNAVRAEIVDGSGRARQPRLPMLRLAAVVIRWLASVGRSRRELLLENIALRQQLATMVQRNRPRIRFADRVFWIALRRVWARWAEVLVIVKPETVVGWHRAGFRLYWQRLSRRGMRRGRPVVPGEVRDLIRRMAAENQWRAPRIHGELLRLGFSVSERTVSRYLRGLPSRPESRQNWRTFMKNHREVIAAMDFFTVPTASFRLLYVLFVIRHGRRDIVHWNITEHPSAQWVSQQMREAFPYDNARHRATRSEDRPAGRRDARSRGRGWAHSHARMFCRSTGSSFGCSSRSPWSCRDPRPVHHHSSRSRPCARHSAPIRVGARVLRSDARSNDRREPARADPPDARRDR